MLNRLRKLKETDLLTRAAEAIRRLLRDIPFLGDPENLQFSAHEGPDLQLRTYSGWTIIFEVKQSAQPRFAHAALLQLKSYVQSMQGRVYPVLVAPYVSLDVRDSCKEADVGFFELSGNCRLAFEQVFIERTGIKAGAAERRELQSLFGTKSSRILRILLREPQRPWKVVELAESAHVSVGQVSNVRAALLAHEWAEVASTSSGFRMTKPGAVLDAWRNVYRRLQLQRTNYYSLFHGEAFTNAARRALSNDVREGAVLRSFSAAQWQAPFARSSTHRFYATAEGEERLRRELQLDPIGKGENVVIERPKDEGIFRDSVEAAPGLWCTNPIQTYLDLTVSGDRGREAAEHLRLYKIEPLWSGAQ
jgi:hypothetical protein